MHSFSETVGATSKFQMPRKLIKQILYLSDTTSMQSSVTPATWHLGYVFFFTIKHSVCTSACFNVTWGATD
jgi:hypothetical protein